MSHRSSFSLDHNGRPVDPIETIVPLLIRGGIMPDLQVTHNETVDGDPVLLLIARCGKVEIPLPFARAQAVNVIKALVRITELLWPGALEDEIETESELPPIPPGCEDLLADAEAGSP